MPMTNEAATHLAALASLIRADRGLSRWDPAGVKAKLRDVAHLELPDVMLAVTRAAADPDARTPGVIPKLDAPHWRERITDPEKPRPIPRDDWCRDCGRHRLNPIHQHPAVTADAEELGHHLFVHIDAPAGDPPPDTLREMVAAARPVCDTPTDDQQ